MLKQIIKGGGLILISVLISKILSLLYIPILARALGPTNLGLYNLALAVLPWFVTLISLSLSTIVAQAVAEARGKKEYLSSLISTYILFAFFLSILGGLLHLFFAKTIALRFFSSPSLVIYIQLASGAIATAILYNILIGIARGMKDFTLYFSMEVMKSFMFVFLGILFLLSFRLNITGALFAIIFSPFIPLLHLLFKYRRYLCNRFNLSLILKNLTATLWVTLVSLFLTVLLTVDKFLLGVYTDPQTVGLYAAVGTLVTALSLISSSFKGSILPFISEHFTHAPTIRSTLHGIVSYALILLSFALLPFVAFRREIIFLLFGEAYLSSVFIAPLLALTLLPFTIYIIVHPVMLDRRLVAHATKRIFFVTLIALFFDILLVKYYSEIGAAVGLLISHSLVTFTYLFILRKQFQFNSAPLLSLVGLIAFFLVATLFLPTSLFSRIPSFFALALIYITLLFLFRYITKKEIDFFLNKLRRIFLRS